MKSACTAALLAPFALLVRSGARERVDEDSGAAALLRNLLDARRVAPVMRAGPALEPARRSASRRTRERNGYLLRDARRALAGQSCDRQRLVLRSSADGSTPLE
jgi:hypothetical protein